MRRHSNYRHNIPPPDFITYVRYARTWVFASTWVRLIAAAGVAVALLWLIL